MRWSIITGEYPDQFGGVADYSRLIALGLAAAGDRVEIWVPVSRDRHVAEPPIILHELADQFGPRAIFQLNKSLRSDSESEILVQYVPHAFGMRALNVPFCLWLYSMRRARISVMFHEVAYPVTRNQPLKHTLLGVANRMMASLAARAASRIFVSTPAWLDLVRSLAPAGARIQWRPVPTSVPVAAGDASADIRKTLVPAGRLLVGHFGTYSRLIVDTLSDCVCALTAGRNDRSVLLMGRGSREFRDCLVAHNPRLHGSVHATGSLDAYVLSRHIAACDVMIQPYPDGVSSRRSSIMVPLSHGVPTVTNLGISSEQCWRDSGAVALTGDGSVHSLVQMAERLLSDERERMRLRNDSRQLYGDLFDVNHTIEALRGP